jgi:DNA-binding NtrC family response regulator
MRGPDRTAKLSILLCDDEVRFRTMLEQVLREEGHKVHPVADGPTAISALTAAGPFDLVITDMRMPGVGGFAVLEAAKQARGAPAVVAITGYASIDETVLAIRHGATDYLAKPFPIDRLLEVVASVTKERAERPPAPPARAPQPPAPVKPRSLPTPAPVSTADQASRCGFVGESDAMRAVYARLLRFAPLDATVLIQGETGTGKELAAAALHDLSHRKRGPLVKVNCATLDRALFESALFGHVRGAFTGAVGEKEGLFHAAAGATIFLDEVGEIPLDLQSKLLRAIETKEFLRVGGTAPERVDVRIVAASNRDLEAEASRGRFREDLYFRLSGFVIAMPPLRERAGDVHLLAKYYLDRFAKEQGKETLVFAPEVLARLDDYEWPGNVRELENSVRVLVACANRSTIDLRDLPTRLANVTPSSNPTPAPAVSGADENYHDAKERVLEAFERRYFADLVATCGGSLSAAARKAGLDRKSLRQKLRKLGLGLPTPPPPRAREPVEEELAEAEADVEDDAL